MNNASSKQKSQSEFKGTPSGVFGDSCVTTPSRDENSTGPPPLYMSISFFFVKQSGSSVIIFPSRLTQPGKTQSGGTVTLKDFTLHINTGRKRSL